MSTEIRVPATGNAGEASVLAELKAVLGSTVSAGEVVAVLETAKASVEVEAPSAGVVLDVRCAVGDELPEHSVLMVIGDAGEIMENNPLGDSGADQVEATHSVAPESLPESTGTSLVIENEYGAFPASPRARILAQRNGLDLAGVIGSGPKGRIIVPDVLKEIRPQGLRSSSNVCEASPTQDGVGQFVTVAVRGARKITAQRMGQSLQDSAQVTLTRYASADSLASFYDRLRSYRDAQGLPRISMSDLINFAVVQTLPRYVAANSIFDWEGIRQYSTVNLGVAVDTGAALVVPVVKHADAMSLPQLSAATTALVAKARAGAMAVNDMADGTFTVTNLGMFGVHWFTPVLNTPQSCILGVGAIHQPSSAVPALLPLSFTFDHRALDGAEAARSLAAISEAIENIDVISSILPKTGQDYSS
jgi:pyruvate dehydrogenase E2 component (dihydrolipoamide acetyltransferase)